MAQLSYIVILHQTTTRSVQITAGCCCLISLFYIKPQHDGKLLHIYRVVLYRYSTSNHNVACYTDVEGVVVLYRYSTSNHNNNPIPFRIYQLSYIVILHQTTTVAGATVTWLTLSYIVILHQTTTS